MSKRDPPVRYVRPAWNAKRSTCAECGAVEEQSSRLLAHLTVCTGCITVTVERYRRTRFWAVYEAGELLCVTVYKKGALAVGRRIRRARSGEPDPNVQKIAHSATELTFST